jgi:hypothetical protein
MRRSRGSGPPGSHQRLAEYLAAEEPAVSARLAAPAEAIEASGRSGGSIEVETLEQVGKQGIHR